MKFTTEDADRASEQAIENYAATLLLETPEEAKVALEYLISKAARGIEKYCGISASCEVLYRTLIHLQKSLKAAMKPYVFFRENGWYPVEYPSDEDAVNGAILNVGTIRVETPDGRIVWEQAKH